MKKIFVSTSSFAKYDELPLKMLKDAGMDVHLNPHGRKLTTDECLDFFSNVDGLIAGTENLSAAVLKSAPNLKVISRCGVGMDSVDVEAACQLGMQVFNTPYGPTTAAAELTVALILSLLRRIPQMNSEIHVGKWQKHMGSLLHGKNVGIIGFGRIGQKVAELLTGFGVQIAYCDPIVEKEIQHYQCSNLHALLEWADIITIHTSGKDTLLGYEELMKMKKGSWIANCSRGGIIDEQALNQALKDGWLSGAALDVFEKEPYNGPLLELDNVILTPHIGSYAIEARIEMEIQAVKNLIEGFNTI